MKKLTLIILVIVITMSNSFSQCINCPGSSTDSINTSSALGGQCIASGQYSFAVGYKCETKALESFAIGGYLNVATNASNSMVIGSGFGDTYQLSNDFANSIMIGNGSTKPTLFISPSNSIPYPHDKTGKVGIGNVTNPLAKLHLRADNDESANLFLEPSNWTIDYNAEIFLGNQQHGISAELNKGLVFRTQNFYLFNQGNLGIGTETPAAKVHIKSGDIYIEDIDRGIIMKSPDGTCWRGTLNDQGQLIFQTLSECPEDAAISIKESTPNKLDISIHPNPAKNIIEIEIPEIGSKSIAFKLVDENGIVVKSLKITGISTSVNISDLAPGLYLGYFTGEQDFFVEKIIKL